MQYLRQFCNISVNFEVTKMVEPLWKSQDQAFSILDVWGGTLQYVWRVFLKKCRMDQRRYKNRHWIPMFIIYIQPWPENCGIGRLQNVSFYNVQSLCLMFNALLKVITWVFKSTSCSRVFWLSLYVYKLRLKLFYLKKNFLLFSNGLSKFFSQLIDEMEIFFCYELAL